MGDRTLAALKGDCGTCIRRGVLADAGRANGEGGMISRGDCGFDLMPETAGRLIDVRRIVDVAVEEVDELSLDIVE